MNTASAPFFSVVVPCYNHGRFVSDAIYSILNQSFGAWELIFVDDGSLDNSYDVVSGLSACDNRIRVFRKSNGGLSAARNFGLNKACGEWVLFLDSDDRVAPDYFRVVADFIAGSKTLDLIGVGYRYMDASLQTVVHQVLPTKLNFGESFFASNQGPPHAFVVRRSFLSFTGVFDESLRSAEDWDLWIRFIKARGQVGVIRKILADYRVVADSMSRQALTMFMETKRVILRIPVMDERISPAVSQVLYRNSDILEILKRTLLSCVGLAVYQGNLALALELFHQQKNELRLQVSTDDYKHLVSYLNFRYTLDPVGLNAVLTVTRRRFEEFFSDVSLKSEKLKVIHMLFRPYHLASMKLKWGNFMGSVVHFLTW